MNNFDKHSVNIFGQGCGRQEGFYGKEVEEPKIVGASMMFPAQGIQGIQGIQGGAGAQHGGFQSGIGPIQQQGWEVMNGNYYMVTSQNPPENGYYISNFIAGAPYPQTVGNQYTQEVIAERLQLCLPPPPLAEVVPRPQVSFPVTQKRAKRKSKFTKEQDEMIIALKKDGKSWVEIAEITGVGSYLAARNRYQVIVGQQGNNNLASWKEEDKIILQKMLDLAELEKWEFIASELKMSTGKNFSGKECREAIRALFWKSPMAFGVNEATLNECVKEKRITEKIHEQDLNCNSERKYSASLTEDSRPLN